MQRFRKSTRPCARVCSSAFSRAPARMNAGLTGGASDRLDWQPGKRVTPRTRTTEVPTRPRFILEGEPENGADLKIGLVTGTGHLSQGGDRCPPGSLPDGDIRAGEEFPGLGIRPIREGDFVHEFRAE